VVGGDVGGGVVVGGAVVGGAVVGGAVVVGRSVVVGASVELVAGTGAPPVSASSGPLAPAIAARTNRPPAATAPICAGRDHARQSYHRCWVGGGVGYQSSGFDGSGVSGPDE
jgi:hypothetical protein